jgi:GT2 family glycosyltransferase
MSAEMYELSIVIPTCNRGDLLQRAITTIAESTQVNYQIIIVDGASTDHTPAVIASARATLGERVVCIREHQREGFVRGVNKGFRAACGRAICWLNDDARPAPGALDRAYAQLMTSPPRVGLLAMFHAWKSPKNVAYQTSCGAETYSLCHVRSTLYANFGMGRRTIFEQLNYFDERYIFCGADPDFSLKCWHAGLSVEPAWGAYVAAPR